MTRLSLLCVPLALFAATSSARAQHADASGTVTSARTSSPPHGARPAAAHPASGGAWTGSASQWGGSPPPARSREHAAYPAERYPYVPVIVVVLPPVQVAPDTAVAGYDTGVTQMRVITTRASRELTTLDVYRQQRFAAP
jgi:hypothetical protein